MELEPSSTDFNPEPDSRPRVNDPPPVNLLTIDDARLIASAGMEKQLDVLYLDVLRFERDVESPGIVYRAENFRLRFELVEKLPPREDYRPLAVIVPSLADMELRLIEAEIAFTWNRGIFPGQDRLQIIDPAGNRIDILEMQRVL